MPSLVRWAHVGHTWGTHVLMARSPVKHTVISDCTHTHTHFIIAVLSQSYTLFRVAQSDICNLKSAEPESEDRRPSGVCPCTSQLPPVPCPRPADFFPPHAASPALGPPPGSLLPRGLLCRSGALGEGSLTEKRRGKGARAVSFP